MLDCILGTNINLLFKQSSLGLLEIDIAKLVVVRITSLSNIDGAAKIIYAKCLKC